MIDSGDIYRADLGEERLRHVLVLSNSQFNRATDRVLVAPQRDAAALTMRAPWHVEIDDEVYAVELALTLSVRHLLDHIGQAPYPAVVRARRALLAIT